MKKLLVSISLLAVVVGTTPCHPASPPSAPPLIVQEVDGSPKGPVNKIIVSNGSLTNNGGGSFTYVPSAANTAAALASDPADCSAGQAPTGINASGVAQNCTAYAIPNASTTGSAGSLLSPASELTIASDAITVTGGAHTVDTESDAASDDLVTINGGADGKVIFLRAAHTDRTVVLKETGNIVLTHGTTLTLDSTGRWVMLYYDGNLSKWVCDALTDTLSLRELTLGGVILGDSSPDAAGELGYASTQLSVHDGTASRSLLQVASTEITKTEYIPIAYAEDGAAAPAAASVWADTRKAKVRVFAADADDDVEIHWIAPLDYSGGIKFRVIGFVDNATAPANTETVIFNLAGCSVGNSDDGGCTLGTGVDATFTADATYAQHDRWSTAYSTEVTVPNIAAGKSVMLKLFRDVDDTYGKGIGVAGIEIKYKAKINAVGDY